MNLDKLETDLIKIIREVLKQVDSINLKNDNSIVTSCDIDIEKNLIIYLKEKFSKIEIISEEDYKSHKEIYNLNNSILVLIREVNNFQEVFKLLVHSIFYESPN